jgi:hypothetical protein
LEANKTKRLTGRCETILNHMGNEKTGNGNYRARITIRGFLQEYGVNYFSHSTAASVANESTIKIVVTFLVVTTWKAQVIDVKGAFLKGHFTDDENLYLHISQGFEIF